MYILIRIFPYLVGVISLVGFEFLIKDITNFWWMGIVMVSCLLIADWLIVKNKLGPQEKLNFILIPLLLQISSLFFLLFLEASLLRHFFVLLISLFLGFYLEKVLIFLWQPEKHKPRQLANISMFFHVLIIFFIATSLFGLSVYLNFPIWWLLLTMLVSLSVISGFNFWSNKIELKKSLEWRTILVISFCELFFLLDLWPLSFFIKAILFVSLYYLTNIIAVKQTSGSLRSPLVWKNGLLVAGIWILVSLTARW